MDPLLFSAALGVLHGLDPGKGWLFVAHARLVHRSNARAAAALLAVWAGHSWAVAITLLAATQALQVARPAAAAAMAAVGLWTAAGRHHTAARPWSGPPALLAASFLAGLAHGGGLLLAPLCGADAAGVLAVHIAAALAAMAAAGYALAGAISALRRLWINLDPLWGAALVAAGLYTALQ